MITYAVDFETYYDKECSVSVLGQRGYFSHPQFDAYLVTIVGDDGYVYAGCPKKFDWDKLTGHLLVSHNKMFDCSLYLYGVEVGWWNKCEYSEWQCTADMAAFLGLPRALKNAANAVFGLEVSKTTRDNMKGKRWETMTEEFRKEVTDYAILDSELCLRLWNELSPQWPKVERAISSLNCAIGQRGIPIDADLLKKNLEVIKLELFNAVQAIPWIAEFTPLSRKAFNEQCRKQNIVPPVSLAQDSEDANEWFEKHQEACPWAKSVQNYRRINAFLKKLEAFDKGTMPDGRYYGGLMYCGANPTARFSGSGGNLNLQNLPRDVMFGVNFRHMIKPKAGHRLIVADLSQIEVRTLCWLAKDKKALDLIRDSEDIYHAFGTLLGLHDPKNGQLKDYDKSLRQKIKSIVLGCFEAETLVLTDSGWKPILYLDLHDKVWDGVEWVSHKGIVCRGLQPTIRKYGVGATADHAILTEHGWQEWSEVAINHTLMKSAVQSATLPCLSGSTVKNHGIQKCNVYVGGLVSLTAITLNQEDRRDVTNALKKNRQKQIGKIVDTRITLKTIPQESDYLTEYPLVLTDAITRTTRSSIITAAVESLCMNRGETIDVNFSTIYQNSMGGTRENYNLTVSTTIKDMSRIILDSYQDRRICVTEEKLGYSKLEFPNSKQKSLVYDVSYSGPRNRFTILTDVGPMIVHNCGYGMGPKKFSAFANVSDKEAEDSIKLYRDKMSSVVKLWKGLDNDMVMSCSLNVPFEIRLPVGRKMRYGVLKKMRDLSSGLSSKFRYFGKLVRMGQLRDTVLWGGTLTENLSQGLARDIFADMMLRVDAAGIPIILHVHDEMVCEVPEDQAEEALATILKIMHTPPDWIPDIPVAAEGHILDLYSK